MNKPWPLWQKLAVAAVALVLACELLPTLDLTISGWFWRPDAGGFWLRDTWLAVGVYWGTRVMTTTIALALLGTIVYGFSGHAPARRSLGRRALLVLLAMALGPGLIVHNVFKNEWGRPRPTQIVDFGGTGHYVPPGIPSNQCARNCSFVSAHAAAGYVLMAGGLLWPARRRRWIWIGLVVGSVIGVVRIIQGGHFLSDVIGAAVVVAATNRAIENWARRRGWLAAPPA